MTTATNPPRSHPQTESNIGPAISGFLFLFVLPAMIVGFRTMLIVATVVAFVLFLQKMCEVFGIGQPTTDRKVSPAPVAALPVQTPAPVVASAVEPISAPATEVTAPVPDPPVEDEPDPEPATAQPSLGRFIPDVDDALETLDPTPRKYNADAKRLAELIQTILIESGAEWAFVTDVAERAGMSAKAVTALCASDGLERVTDLRKMGGPQRAAFLLADVDDYLGTDTRALIAESGKPRRHLHAV